MKGLSAGQFEDFFHELHGRPAYSWQTRLAARAVEGNWPRAIDLPTGSGKTACIDIAVYALACQASRDLAKRAAPRRIFFCVNRRVIVGEAYQRARRIRDRLWSAERARDPGSPILVEVAAALRQVAGTSERDDSPPLDVLELRGGIYRDNSWARSAAQPSVVCTTIDQLGSRLLFRGYGVSPSAAPIQAALIAYDSLVLLDEAHISEPFRQSLESVQGYLNPERWARQSIGVRPLIFIPMTATPAGDIAASEVISIDDKDRANESLAQRLAAAKKATLVDPVTDVPKAIADIFGKEAEVSPAAVGIIVNRVATAKDVYRRLREKHPTALVELVIGSMRPIDREKQSDRLKGLVGPNRPSVSLSTSFVVATQCLEVGADYDFDVLITECASLDSLRQRFGRLNRGGRAIEARARILIRRKDAKSEDSLDDDKPFDADPIYGNALARTWNWLVAHATAAPMPEAEAGGKSGRGKLKPAAEVLSVDFGIDALKELLGDGSQIPGELIAPSAASNAPVMLPAYVNFWCQTSPRPVPEPDVALFIHGQQRGEPDVQICWRADLVEAEPMVRDHWCDVVALLPPTSAECISAPISRVRRWIAQEGDLAVEGGDLLGAPSQPEKEQPRHDRGPQNGMKKAGVLWRGAKKSILLQSAGDLQPGDTLVLPAAAGGWMDLGHVPETGPHAPSPSVDSGLDSIESPSEPGRIDIAEEAFARARAKYVLRLHRSLIDKSPAGEQLEAILNRLNDFQEAPTRDELANVLRESASDLPEANPAFQARLQYFAGNRFFREPYPDGRGVVLTASQMMKDGRRPLPALDDGEDDASRVGREKPVTLADHTDHVVKSLTQGLGLVRTDVGERAYLVAAERHDWGKADDRFQALLRGTDRTDAWLVARSTSALLLAKSDGVPRTLGEYKSALARSGLPSGFRHEMLSLQFAERARFPEDVASERDLILHLIAAHHGHSRPFAPVVLDAEPPDVEFGKVTLTTSDRAASHPHRLDSGVADRFWALTTRFGWWGLAYLESLLRLADQRASSDEDAGRYENCTGAQSTEATS